MNCRLNRGSVVGYRFANPVHDAALDGSLLGAPQWLVELTPFEHVGLVPAQPFRAGAALAMLAIGAAAGSASLAAFRRRDLAAG